MRIPLHCFVFYLSCLGLNAWAVEMMAPPHVQVEDTTVTIRWKTDVECGTRASYGLSPELMDQRLEGGVTALHEVRLEKLKKSTQYFYRIGSAKVWLHTGSFTTAGDKPSISKNAETPRPASSSTPTVLRLKAPPARVTWGNISSLQDHYDRHGRDFQSVNPEDYARQAWEFLQRAQREGLPVKQDEHDGVLRIYDPKTGAFAAYNRDGTTKTYFKPDSPDYWQRQPGRVVKLKSPESP